MQRNRTRCRRRSVAKTAARKRGGKKAARGGNRRKKAARGGNGFEKAVGKKSSAMPPPVWSQLEYPQVDPAALQRAAARPPSSSPSPPSASKVDHEAAPVVFADGSKGWFALGSKVLHREGDKPALIHANGDQVFMKHGKMHRDRGPAFIGADGTMEWYTDGEKRQERKSTPLETLPIDNYALILTNLGVDDLLQLATSGPVFRRRLPELVQSGFTYHPNRTLESYEMHLFDKWEIPLDYPYLVHVVRRSKNPQGNVTKETWHLNGSKVLHNDAGPALIQWNDSSVMMEYYINGKLHRDDGPARVTVLTAEGNAKHGGFKSKDWFQHGVHRRGNGQPPGVPGSKPASVYITNRTVYRHWNDNNGQLIDSDDSPVPDAGTEDDDGDLEFDDMPPPPRAAADSVVQRRGRK